MHEAHYRGCILNRLEDVIPLLLKGELANGTALRISDVYFLSAQTSKLLILIQHPFNSEGPGIEPKGLGCLRQLGNLGRRQEGALKDI